MSKIVAIQHEIEDENTGAMATYHVLEYLNIDYKYQNVTATLNGYVSKKAYDGGRNPLCSHSLNIQSLPEDGEVSRDWLYSKAVEADNEGSVFAGSELINN